METAKIDKIVGCDFFRTPSCEGDIALYDGKTKFGSWAFMCEKCFKLYGIGLGLGKGQKLQTQGEKK